jgi:hypothetical protein
MATRKPSQTPAAPKGQAAPQPGRLRKAEQLRDPETISLRGRRRRSLDENEPLVSFGLFRNLGGNIKQHREARQALRDDPELRRVVAARVLAMAEEDGVDTSEDRPVLAWILKNLPAILKMIFDLLAGVPPTFPAPPAA